MTGALSRHVAESVSGDFQPMGANFGILPPLEETIRDKRQRYAALAQRALDRLPISGRPVSRRTTPEALYAQRAAAYARFSDGTADNNGTPDETVRQILEAWT